ncbi:nucleotidyltransferase [Luteolibacter sp. Populi]|uniref:nucleotidyltransferase n=1 Tax=Luteolibacter sp. Populi TaxID=3230487 RepID=UPI00346633BE
MMEPSFEKLLVLLVEAGVRFVVVGGIAVTLQGYVRLTEDIDLLLDGEPSNIRRFLDLMAGYGEGFARELSPDDFGDEEGAIRIVEETEQCQVDIFTRMSGRRYEDVIVDVDTFEVRGKFVAIASKLSLIGWKEKSVREKDRLDAMALRRLIDDPRAFD